MSKVINHAGGIEGFKTNLSYVPDKRIAVVVLSNVNGSAPDEMASQLVKVMLGETVTLATDRKEQAITSSELEQFVGTFQLAPTFVLTFTVEGGHLIGQATGQVKNPLFYEGTKAGHPQFFLKVVNAQIEFLPDANGRPSSLILHQGGHDICR